MERAQQISCLQTSVWTSQKHREPPVVTVKPSLPQAADAVWWTGIVLMQRGSARCGIQLFRGDGICVIPDAALSFCVLSEFLYFSHPEYIPWHEESQFLWKK